MSTSFGLWLVEKLQNLITDPEFRASAKGTISYYGAGIRPATYTKIARSKNREILGWVASGVWKKVFGPYVQFFLKGAGPIYLPTYLHIYLPS